MFGHSTYPVSKSIFQKNWSITIVYYYSWNFSIHETIDQKLDEKESINAERRDKHSLFCFFASYRIVPYPTVS